MRARIPGLLLLIALVPFSRGQENRSCALDILLRSRTASDVQVILTARHANGTEFSSTVSLVDGSVIHFPEVPCGTYTVACTISPVTNLLSIPLAQETVDVQGIQTREFTLPPLSVLDIKAMDPAGGPVPSQGVMLFYQETGLGWVPGLRWVNTNEWGTARMIVPPGNYRLHVPGNGTVERMELNGRPVDPEHLQLVEGPSNLVLYCTPGSAVQGEVIDEKGKGLKGILILVFHEKENIAYAETGAAGEFSVFINQFPATITLEDSEGNWAFDPPKVEVTQEALPKQVRILATKAKPFFVLRIVDQETSAPIKGVWTAVDIPPSGRVIKESGSEGFFSVLCEKRQNLKFDLDGNSVGYERKNFEAECPGEATVKLSRQGLSVSGRVFGARKEPVAGLRFEIRHLEGDETFLGTTDSKGRFLSYVSEPGRYLITPTPRNKGVLQKASLQRVTGPKPADHQQAIFEVGPEGAKDLEFIVVRNGKVCLGVTDEKNARVPLLVIAARDWNSEARLGSFHPQPGPSETCVENLPPGQYSIRIRPKEKTLPPAWFPGEIERDFASPVLVKEGEEVVLPDLRLPQTAILRILLPEAGPGKDPPIPQIILRGEEENRKKQVRLPEDLVEWVSENELKAIVPLGRWSVGLRFPDGSKEYASVSPVQVENPAGGVVVLEGSSADR